MSTYVKNYRWDVQGLRAIAVLAVVIFHINPMLLPGGYVGVDIFFVISGYLIMGFIWRDLQNNNFNLLRFYIKRVYRLFPALFVTVVISSIIAYFMLLPTESADYIKSLISTLFYFSNFYFYSESDYFNTAMQFSPLLHTWSLSVEEQFYIVFPFVLIFIYRKRKIQISKILILLALLSLLLSELFIYKDSAFAFFASPTRFFQFIIGGYIAISLQDNRLGKMLNDVLGGVGFLLIILSVFSYNDKTLFPGLNALLPSLGAALILFSGMNARYSSMFLSNNVFKLIGNASYSIYLWHWPLIVFYKLKFSPNLSINEQIVLFVLSIVLGYLSWKYIENTTRKRNFNVVNLKPIFFTMGISLFLALSTYFIFTTFSYNTLDHKSKAAQYLDFNTTNFRPGKCFLTSKHDNVNFFNKEECVTHIEGKKNYLLVGDSHAAHYYSALEEMLMDNETLTQVTASGCKPISPYKGAKRCTDLVKWAYETLIIDKRFDTIILSGHWGHMSGSDIRESMKTLLQHTDKVVILGPSMQYSQALPRLLIELSSDKDSAMLYKTAGKYKPLSVIDRAMASYFSIDNVQYISVLDTLCNQTTGCKVLTPEGIPINFDESHLTHEGALYILGQFKYEIFDR